MHQHRSLSLAFLLCCLVGSACAASPNIIIFFADDLGYGDVGYQGGDLPTPHIDSIAHNGVQFTDGYVTCPVCAPSRAGLLTGRYQQRFGFADNPGPYQRKGAAYVGIPPSQPILSENCSFRSTRHTNTPPSLRIQTESTILPERTRVNVHAKRWRITRFIYISPDPNSATNVFTCPPAAPKHVLHSASACFRKVFFATL